MPVKREPSEPQGFIKPNGVGIPALQDGEEVKAAVSTCVPSGCQSFRLGISRNPVSETMQGMYQILDGK